MPPIDTTAAAVPVFLMKFLLDELMAINLVFLIFAQLALCVFALYPPI
jgi:hypothetical protein